LNEKRGQIAHLDKDPSNWAEDNLAFMCLDHHTLFDSKTSQHKNYTMQEVKTARRKLYETIALGKHRVGATSHAVYAPGVVAGRRFFEQRRGLPDTKTLKEIWAKPHWRILICPNEFMEAQFRDLSSCRRFVRQHAVRWHPLEDYPEETLASVEEDPSGQWVTGEVNRPGLHAKLELWTLFRSGQFVHNRALPDVPQLESNVHILEVRRVVAQVFEFARRMAHAGVLSHEATINVELQRIDGRGLFVPDCNESYWCKRHDIVVQRQVGSEDLAVQSRDLSMGVALDIYKGFGCKDPPRALLVQDLDREPH